MSMLSLRRSQKQSGFTLMELLIVIAVLGLLLGLIAPRMGGITTDTADNVCDTNNKGIRYYTQMFFNASNSYPSGLTNLVDLTPSTALDNPDGTTAETYQYAYLPKIQDDLVADAEVISLSFAERNYPGAYCLSTTEISELRDMGVSTVYNLQGTNRPMQKATLSAMEYPYVMMMGLAAEPSGTPTLALSAKDGSTTVASGEVGNPNWIGRIFLAVNDQCELVTTGMIQASALCPTAVLNESKFSHKEFTLVLPRLEATVERVNGYSETDSTVSTTTYEGFVALFRTEANDDGNFVFVDAEDEDTGRQLEVSFEAQETWQFDVSCPEGHKWPADDEENWVLQAGNLTYTDD